MRTMAQVIGYAWLAWIAYVILGSMILSLIDFPGDFDSGMSAFGPKLFLEVLTNLILATPGVLLVVWGRARKKIQAKQQGPLG